MFKEELEAGLVDLDAALAKAFPKAEPIECMLIGGACLVFEGVTSRSTQDMDVIIFNLLGSQEESTLVFDAPLAHKVRRIIKRIGRRRFGLQGEHALFFNDNAAPFLLELSRNELPPMRLWRAYSKIHLYVPVDLRYILALKLLAGRREKDHDDIYKLCQMFGVTTRAQAQSVVNRYFRSPLDQISHGLAKTLKELFDQ